MPVAKVLYASITGNNEDIADLIAETFEENDITTEIEDAAMIELSDLEDADFCVMCPYTYSGGSLPDEGLDLYEDLEDADLSGKIFGVAGSGDTFYGDDFCAAVLKFDAAFEKAGATRGATPVKINLAPDEPDDLQALQQFTESLIKTFNER
ncbi:flavodoxin [Ligilactobacillus ceti]|uniref:Flavodoxin n=1 Tax=Ligilactobacillus ceti DSM 22408 TaxID=1122146 RepID=A0A0R2KUG9_9LACO|nr:flavodoxin [Ligilactobacillus ceti]KRN90362.1 Flavodoxin [Ligilactobacillus ceti DSM 22408]